VSLTSNTSTHDSGQILIIEALLSSNHMFFWKMVSEVVE